MFLLTQITRAQVPLKKIYVADHFAHCHLQGHDRCLLIKDSINGKWENLQGSIENFHYQEGNFYELLVEIHTIKNSPQDTTTFHYALSKILVKTKVDIADIFELDDAPWFLTKMNSGNKNNAAKIHDAFVIFDVDEQLVSGNTGCNRFSGIITVSDSSLKIEKLNATKMSCQGTINETDFLNELAKVSGYKIKSKQLFLYDNKQLLLIFRQKWYKSRFYDLISF